MRVAALAFGVLAGLVASLILALGGLDVAADLGPAAARQSQAIRFGLFIIGNLGVFGAALVLAAPLAGAVFLALGAVSWVGAALVMHHSTDLVLITPPALLLIAAAFAVVAHFRRPAPADDEDADPEIIAPQRDERDNPAETMEIEEDVGLPAFAAEQRSEPSVRGAFSDDRGPPAGSDWNPRRRQPPPPRTKPAFRPVEEEYDDEEPSGFSRFALGLSGMLSFGLYAALAGAAVLIFWSLRNDTEVPSATVAEVPAVSSSVSATPSAPSSSAEPSLSQLPSAAATLEPILGGEPIRQVETSPVAAPSTTPSELVAETATPQDPGTFGAVTMPNGQVTIPTLGDDFTNEESGEPLPPVTASPPSLPPEEASSEPLAEASAPVDLDSPAPEPSLPAAGQPLPRPVPPSMALLRTAPGTGPTVVAAPLGNANNTGL